MESSTPPTTVSSGEAVCGTVENPPPSSLPEVESYLPQVDSSLPQVDSTLPQVENEDPAINAANYLQSLGLTIPYETIIRHEMLDAPLKLVSYSERSDSCISWKVLPECAVPEGII